MREGAKRVDILPDETYNIVNLPSYKNENTAKILEALSEKMKLTKNKDTAAILDALSERINYLETQKTLETPDGVELNSCSFKHTCYTAKSKMGSCPCELYR